MTLKFFEKKFVVSLVFSGIILFFSLFSYHCKIFSPIENIFYDLRFKLRGYLKTSGNIVIIKIDEESLNELGRWPWDRKIIAQAVRNLFSAGVKVVGLDIIFPQPSNKISDLYLSNALKQGNSVIAIHFEETYQTVITENKINKIKVEIPLLPIPQLQTAAKLGFTNVYPDIDGVPRNYVLFKTWNNKKYYSFDMVIAETFLEKSIDLPQQIYINYYGPSEYTTPTSLRSLYTFNNYSFVAIYKNIIPASWLKNKIALIGATATATYDHYPIPYQKIFPGVELHANVIENILNNTYLTKIDKKYYILLVVFITSLITILFYKIHPLLTAILIVLTTVGYYFVTVLLFIKARLILDFVPIAVVITTIGFINILQKVLLEQQEKKKIKNIFSKYINPYVMEELLSDSSSLVKLGGVKRVITVMFTDIRNFTTISEQLQPEEIVCLLNEYLEVMSELILKYNGTVDKYIGDSIMCFWNAPLLQPDHAESAVKCAINMLSELEKLNQKFVLEKKPKIAVGIGINTGEAIVGNIGSTKIMEYTAIGDTINTASRLQELTKEYHTPIILSEFTYSLVKDTIPCVSLGKINLRGKTHEIEIFKIKDTPELVIAEI